MKRLLAIAAIAALIFAVTVPTVQAQAPTYGWDYICTSNSFTVAATEGTNVAKVFDVRKQDTIALQIELMADASGAYEFRIPIQESVDGNIWATMASRSINISFNGVTKQTIVTNVPTHGVGYLKIPFLTNCTAAINVTNGIIKKAVKMSAP